MQRAELTSPQVSNACRLLIRSGFVIDSNQKILVLREDHVASTRQARDERRFLARLEGCLRRGPMRPIEWAAATGHDHAWVRQGMAILRERGCSIARRATGFEIESARASERDDVEAIVLAAADASPDSVLRLDVLTEVWPFDRNQLADATAKLVQHGVLEPVGGGLFTRCEAA